MFSAAKALRIFVVLILILIKMKTTIRKSLVVALLFGTLSSYALENDNVFNRNINNLEIKNVKKGQRLFIKNANGAIIYKEEVTSNGNFKTAFDFSSLKNGYYTLEVSKDFQIEITPFTIVLGEVTFHKKAETTVFKPVVRTEDNKVLVSRIDFKNNPLEISIFFEGKRIYNDTVKGKVILERVYQLRKDISGKYKVVVKANDRTYINEFSL